MEKTEFIRRENAILDASRKATSIITRNEGHKKLIEILIETRQLWPEDLWGIIMSIRGMALRHKLPTQQLSVLGDACWMLQEESSKEADKIFFGRLATNLKVKTCSLFAAVLSGGEVSCKNEIGWKHYSLSRIPIDTREIEGISFSVSKKNTIAILRAYDRLIEKVKAENNELSRKHWLTQKETFLYLLEHMAPKLLEPSTFTKSAN